MASGGQRDIELQAQLGRTITSEMWYFSKVGRGFIASAEFTNATAGDTAALTVENPAASDTTAVFSPLSASALTQSYVRVYDTFTTEPSGGSGDDIQNVILDSANGAPDTGDVVARTGDTYTAASTHVSDLIGGGSGAQSISGHDDMPVLALEPGRRAVIEVEKLASGGDEVAITARWFEVPSVFSEADPDFEVSDYYR